MEQKLIKIIYSKFAQDYNYKLPKDELTLGRITDVSRKAILELKNKERAEINIPFIHSDKNGPKHIIFSVTEEFINSYFQNVSENNDLTPLEEPELMASDMFFNKTPKKEAKIETTKQESFRLPT